jgi:hypothetical protein
MIVIGPAPNDDNAPDETSDNNAVAVTTIASNMSSDAASPS